MMRSSGCERTASCIANAVSKICRAYSQVARRGRGCTIDAHVAASSPPEREPSMPGDAYLPPRPVGQEEVLALRSALSRNASTDVPLKP